jgi:hypothetical protein
MVSIVINKFDIQNLLGSNINSENVQDLFKSSVIEPEITKQNEFCQYSFHSLGFRLIVARNGLITMIYIYSEGSHNYNQFSGPIPYDIKFSDTQKIVEQNLGKPNKQCLGALGYDRNWCNWKGKGISISFRINGQIDNLCLFY